MNSIAKARTITILPTHKPYSSTPNLATPITTHLTSGATWSTLSATFPSLPLSHHLTQTILLSLKHPSHAKPALLFFHWSAKHLHFTHSPRSYSIIIHLLVRANLLTDARALLESTVKNNHSVAHTLSTTFHDSESGPRVYDLLLLTYAKLRMTEEAFQAMLHVKACHGFSLSVASFNSVLYAAEKSGRSDLGWKVFEHMIERRVYPNQATVETMVNLMAKEGTLLKTVDVLDRILTRRCAPVVVVGAAVALRVIAEKRVDDAVVMLKRMLQKNMVPDEVVHSMIVAGRCGTGELELAGELFDEMVRRGCSKNAFVYTAFIKAECNAGRVDEACGLMQEMKSIGLKPYGETYSALIEGCSIADRVEESLVVFEEMAGRRLLPDRAACNAMFKRLCEAGEVAKADEILTALLERGFDADETTYLHLMDGFAKVGNADGVLRLYYEMKHKGVDVSMEVYASLVKNLNQCGKLKEAENFQIMMEEKYS